VTLTILQWPFQRAEQRRTGSSGSAQAGRRPASHDPHASERWPAGTQPSCVWSHLHWRLRILTHVRDHVTLSGWH